MNRKEVHVTINAIAYKGYRVAFSLDSQVNNLQRGWVRIYGLQMSTIESINPEAPITLEATCGDDMSEIFVGQVVNKQFYTETGSRVLEVSVIVNYNDDSVTSLSFRSGVTGDEVVSTITRMLEGSGVTLTLDDKARATAAAFTVNHMLVSHGGTARVLRETLSVMGLIYSWIGDVIYITHQDGAGVPGQIDLTSELNNIIGTPLVTAGYDKYIRVSVSTPLNPAVLPFMTSINLRPKYLQTSLTDGATSSHIRGAGGIYTVSRVTHEVDTHGSLFDTRIEGFTDI